MAPRLAALTALLACVAAGAAADARAGIRPYIWTWDTQTVPPGDVELEQWLWVRGQPWEPSPGDLASYWIWWGPVLGLTQHLEVALPFQTEGDTSGEFYLESFEVDARYRIFSRNDDGKLQPLIRAAFHQSASPKGYSRVDANAVLSYGLPSELRATADLGTRVSLPLLAASSDAPRVQLTYAAGVSYPLLPELRAGVEVFGQVDVASGTGVQRHFAGASVGYQKGRVWLTVGTLVGLTKTTPRFMPRLIWAVAL